MADEITAKAGSEPEIKDTAKAGAEPEKDANADSSSESLPWDKDPRWKSARTAEKKLNELLKANGLEDSDDLVELVNSGKRVKGKLTDIDQLDRILEKASTLDKYEAYWKEQEEHVKRGEETPDQTITRLTREIKKREAMEARKRQESEHVENTKKAITNYEREVQSLVSEMEIPKEQRAFMSEFLGVQNPCNDIDITDRKAVKKLVSDAVKKKEAYDQAVIKAYLDSKTNIPKVAATGGAQTDTTKPKIMLKDARRMFLERMQSAGG